MIFTQTPRLSCPELVVKEGNREEEASLSLKVRVRMKAGGPRVGTVNLKAADAGLASVEAVARVLRKKTYGTSVPSM